MLLLFFSDGIAKTEDGTLVRPEDILIFFTGADQEPPLGFIPKPRLVFVDQNLAESSTCVYRLSLPLNHSNVDSFKYHMILSLMGGMVVLEKFNPYKYNNYDYLIPLHFLLLLSSITMNNKINCFIIKFNIVA